MIDINTQNRPLAATRAVPDPSVLYEVETANGSLLEVVGTYVGIGLSFLAFSTWLLLRSLRIVRHSGEPVTGLFGDPDDF